MEHLLEIDGRINRNGVDVEFHVAVSPPVFDGTDYFCELTSSVLFSRTMQVYGVSQEQAIDLSLRCIKASVEAMILPEGADIS